MLGSSSDGLTGSGRPFRLSFWWGAGFELALLVLALVAAWLWAMPLGETWRWDWLDFTRGLAGTVPLLLMCWWLLKSRSAAPRRIRKFIEGALRPALRHWNVAQMLAISALAGVSEEVLFRAVVQGGLAGEVGPAPAWVLASVLFGICHWITPAYALVAGLMGGYLGGLWWWSGNLLTPMVAHGVYDFVALLWVLRLRRP